MTNDEEKPRRHSIRLRGYDYAQAGAYFVTIVAKDRMCLFGEIIDGEMRRNEFGDIVQSTWSALPHHYSAVECDAFIVMPNHVHGIIVLTAEARVEASQVGAGLKPALPNLKPATPRAGLRPAPTLAEIVRAFKSFSARRINEIRNTPGVPVWQRNYYEHVVRGDEEVHRVREYIVNNPLQWELDRENPLRRSHESRRKTEAWEV